MSELSLDEKGFPILLDVVVPTKSGNDTHSVAGRFGNKADKDGKEPAAANTRGTAGVTSEELARRQDAVREAAREFEQWQPQDASEWLKGRINRGFTQADVDAFLADVRAQQLADLVDILDQNERGVKRGRRFVRVNAPKGYTRKAIGALSDAELGTLVNRLKARGWTATQVKGLAKRLPEARHGVLEGFAEQEPLWTSPF